MNKYCLTGKSVFLTLSGAPRADKSLLPAICRRYLYEVDNESIKFKKYHNENF